MQVDGWYGITGVFVSTCWLLTPISLNAWYFLFLPARCGVLEEEPSVYLFALLSFLEPFHIYFILTLIFVITKKHGRWCWEWYIHAYTTMFPHPHLILLLHLPQTPTTTFLITWPKSHTFLWNSIIYLLSHRTSVAIKVFPCDPYAISSAGSI